MAKSDEAMLLDELKRDFEGIKFKVANKTKDIESEVIEKVVYEAYTQSYYDRRMSEGGLSDTDNMQADYRKIRDGIEIEVSNLTKGNDAYSSAMGYSSGYIQDIVVDGKGYGYGLDSVIGSRDFISATQDRIDDGNEIEDLVELELRKLGYELK